MVPVLELALVAQAGLEHTEIRLPLLPECPAEIFLSFFFYYLFIYYVYNILSVCVSADQKRVPNLITDGCEPPCVAGN